VSSWQTYAQADSTKLNSNSVYKNRLSIGINSPLAKISLPTLPTLGMRYMTLSYERKLKSNYWLNITLPLGIKNNRIERYYGLEVGIYREVAFKHPKWSFRGGLGLFRTYYTLRDKYYYRFAMSNSGFFISGGLNYLVSKNLGLNIQISPYIGVRYINPPGGYGGRLTPIVEPIIKSYDIRQNQAKVGFLRLLSFELKYSF
jgi:hypothetical protein